MYLDIWVVQQLIKEIIGLSGLFIFYILGSTGWNAKIVVLKKNTTALF